MRKIQIPALFQRVVEILEQARTNVTRTVNSQMVIAYWMIGREILLEEQQGNKRADYGTRLIEQLSLKLTEHFGKGFSPSNLWDFRNFYLCYQERTPEILHALRGESAAGSTGFSSRLSWTHYRLLMRVEKAEARSFYEIEAEKNGWSSRQLERQINSLFFQRLLKSRDKKGMLKLATDGQLIEKPIDIIKDPYILEFLDLPESSQLRENKLEEALISHLQEFLMELGNGFAFIGRQKRITMEGDHFYPDLVFYHIKLKCYVIIDLKISRLSHADLGQIMMYVHYYDREMRTADDNPTIGIVLCTDKNETVVRYVLDEKNERIFASRYKLELPKEEDLIKELKKELAVITGDLK
ncbi:MAG: PDDEXK nuclease domain-containing protein [Candidatus Wallbacteria bacterium]|nr:PDDEXK nuclease domain-containing protein [Candidatus Wallbacteria bacterium]